MVGDLQRFVQAQAPVFDAVRQELQSGQKRTHWMWFVFPQLRGLGHSPTARHFGLADLSEARAYLAHATLGPRLLECTALVNQLPRTTAHAIFGTPDDLKFRSCMTLFAMIRREPFDTALRTYFNAEPDPKTVDLLHVG